MGMSAPPPYWAARGASLEGFNMLAEKEVAAPAPSINTDPIFIAIEISRSKWVVGTHIPTSSKVSVHTVEWGDAAALLALVERLRSRPPIFSASRTCRSCAVTKPGTRASGFTAGSPPPGSASW
jgi:hypothetical protein